MKFLFVMLLEISEVLQKTQSKKIRESSAYDPSLLSADFACYNYSHTNRTVALTEADLLDDTFTLSIVKEFSLC